LLCGGVRLKRDLRRAGLKRVTHQPWKTAMSSDLRERLTGGMLTVRMRPLFTMRLDVRPIVDFGQTPTRHRRVGVVFGGEFDGERLAGAVLDGGSDWQSVRTDGSNFLDVRLNLKTIGGALIAMTYKGVRHGPGDVIARLERGEVVA
jgi:hypothetical protein